MCCSWFYWDTFSLCRFQFLTLGPSPANLHGLAFIFFLSLTWVLFFVLKSAQVKERDKYPHLHPWPPGWSHQVHAVRSFPSHSVADHWWGRQVNFQVFRYGKLLLSASKFTKYLFKWWKGVILIHSCSVASAKHQMSGIRMKYPLWTDCWTIVHCKNVIQY